MGQKRDRTCTAELCYLRQFFTLDTCDRQRKNIVLSYGVLLLFMLPMQLVFVIKLFLTESDQSVSWDAIQTQILVIDRYSCLLRLSSITAVFSQW